MAVVADHELMLVGELSEALFLTQGYVYDSAEAADARFAGDTPGFVYSRYANPTVQMFEDRLALLEGADICRAMGFSSPNAAEEHLRALERKGAIEMLAGASRTRWR